VGVAPARRLYRETVLAHSMTAFARSAAQTPLGDLTWEVRSVNHRYREVALRLPEELRFAETAFRDLIAGALARGRVDATLRFHCAIAGEADPAIDNELIQRISGWSDQVRAVMPDAQPLRVGEVLRWPGVMATPAMDEEALGAAATDLLKKALGELTAARSREGQALAAILTERLGAAREILVGFEAQLPEIGSAQRERMAQRMAEVTAQVDAERLEQEVAILLARSEVSEEIDRLKLHFKDVERTLAKAEPIGRRLDFLMQELNREANTLGSKSGHPEQTNASVNLKVVIEQMREQVQNIE